MMGRKRKTRLDLPPRVYFNHGAYYFVTKDGEWIYLHRKYPRAMARYAEIVDSPGGLGAMKDLINRYLREISAKQAPKSHENNLSLSKPLIAVFGVMSPSEITPQDIYAYMDQRKKPVAANREVGLLSGVYKAAIRWGLASRNPCSLVQRNKEKPRDREVEDWEYHAVYQLAPLPIQFVMDFIDMTALRLGDVLALNERDNVTEEGLKALTSKRKKRILFLWTPELKSLVERCREFKKGMEVVGFNLVCNTRGRGYTVSGFESNWQALMARALEKGAIKTRYTCHDIRARAARHEKASELLGHDDPRTTNRIYRRMTVKVLPNTPKIFGSD